MLRTANPALNATVFQDLAASGSDSMTIQGTVNKSFALLALVILGGSFTWLNFLRTGASGSMGWLILGALVGFIAGLVTVFKPKVAHISAPVYALAQGLFLGGISAIMEAQYPGIVINAVFLTFGTLFCLLAAYKSGKIKVTENMRLGIAAATGGLALFYFASWIFSMFGVSFSLINGSGLLGIGFSLFVVAIAALNLVLDFDTIENAARQGAPKQMEWYGAFGLMVTLIWLYMEILRLLMKLRSNRD